MSGQKKKEEESSPWGAVAAIAGIGAAALATGYLISKLLEEKPERSRESTSSRSSLYNCVGNQSHSWRHEGATNVYDAVPEPRVFCTPTPSVEMAVDATPGRGGGLLILPQHEVVCHYSLDWSAYLKFGEKGLESDKFELTNAFIALRLFKKLIPEGVNTVVKVDNSKFSRERGTPDNPDEDDLFYEQVDELRNSIADKWTRTDKKDYVFSYADKLSRSDCNIDDLFSEYSKKNMNKQALTILLECMDEIPKAYHA